MLKKEQSDELSVLSSIFGNDLVIEKPVWGNASFRVSVRLLGQNSVGASLQGSNIQLGITYTANYPKSPPLIEVKHDESSNVTEEESLHLKNLLKEFSERKCRENAPFVFELIQYAKDFLLERSSSSSNKKETLPVPIPTNTTTKQKSPTMLPSSSPREMLSIEQIASSIDSKDDDKKRTKKKEVWREEQEQELEMNNRKVVAASIKPTNQTDVKKLDEVPKRTTGRYADFIELGAVGRGGFGSVVKAENKLDGMIYAVKKIRLSPTDEGMNRKTINEARMLAKLVHPNIVRYFTSWLEESEDVEAQLEEEETEDEFSESEPSIFPSSYASFAENNNDDDDDDDGDFGFEWADGEEEEEQTTVPVVLKSKSPMPRLVNQTLYIVMEFVPSTLRNLIDQGTLVGSENRCYDILREILEALSCVHDLKIIHQDIKPENVLIDSKQSVKLGDFGLAVDQVDLRGGDAGGTTYYRAPEVARGKWDEKCDIFSLGVVVVEMFSPPMTTGSERHAVLTSLRLEPPTLPPSVPPFVLQMLDKSPEKRPSAEQALKMIPGHVLVEHAVDTVIKSIGPSSNAFKRLLKHLFLQPTDLDRFDYPEPGEVAREEGRFSSKVWHELHELNQLPPSEIIVPVTREVSTGVLEQSCIATFKKLGAIRFHAPFLLPSREESTKNKTPALLLDPTGAVVELPFSLTRNFAHFLNGNRDIRFLKRYDSDWTFWARSGSGGQPLSEKSFSYDFVVPLNDVGYEGALISLEEAIETSKEVFLNTKLVSSSSGLVIELGHSEIVDKLFDLVKVPLEIRSVVLQTISTKEMFKDIKEAQNVLAECKCPMNCIQALKFCLPITKKLWVSDAEPLKAKINQEGKMENPSLFDLLVKHVQTAFGNRSEAQSLLNILMDISALANQLLLSGNQVRIVIWPKNYPPDISGIFFKLMLRHRRIVFRTVNKTNSLMYEEGNEFVAADGGRFDSLLTATTKGLIGITSRIYLDRIAKKRAYMNLNGLTMKPLVRICYPLERDSAVFEPSERAKLASKIRSEFNIGVEWAHPVGLSGDALLALCKDSGARIMVSKTVLPSSSSQFEWRVRSWTIPTSSYENNQAELQLSVGIFSDKKCHNHDELLKYIKGILSQILNVRN